MPVERTSTAALHRDKGQHIPQVLVLAKATEDEIQAETLTERFRAISRIERQIELEARLLGQMDEEKAEHSAYADAVNLTPEQIEDDLL